MFSKRWFSLRKPSYHTPEWWWYIISTSGISDHRKAYLWNNQAIHSIGNDISDDKMIRELLRLTERESYRKDGQQG